VNYLRACPLPEAAVAIEELAALDPEAVRRAATLAGLAGIAAGGPTEPPADSALAGAIEPVQGDEDPTAGLPGRVSETRPAAAPAAGEVTAAGGSGWRWLVWAAIVIAVGIVARAALRPGTAGH
jgi:hypothetical protein